MNTINLGNEKKLLKEIRKNNCREILSCEVSIAAAFRTKENEELKPEQVKEIDAFIKTQEQKRNGLILGTSIIDERLSQ